MKRRPANREGMEAWTLPQLERSLPAAAGHVSPLQHLLAVINNPDAPPERRDRAAIAALAYCHPKPADQGAKAARAKAAATAGGADSEWASDLDIDHVARRQ